MTNHKCITLLSIGFVACVLLNSVSSAELVPFKGRYENLPNSSYVGNATHLGRFNGKIAIEAFHAANGDTLVFTITSDQYDVDYPILKYSITREITGGTGRFKDATGYFETWGELNLESGEGDGEVDGLISRPNSKK